MNTSELENAAKNDPYAEKVFAGVYPSDMLPIPLLSNHIYLYNEDISSEKGSHWNLLNYMGPVLQHFDSFGREPTNSFVLHSMNSSCDTIEYSNIQIQSELSQSCGQHVLLVLFFLARGKSLKDILNHVYTPGEYLRNDALANIIISSMTGEAPKPLFSWDILS